MKKIAMMLVALSTAFVCHAQFEQGKKFIGASVTGLNLSYSGSEKSNLGFDSRVGYAVEDNWMLMAQGSVNLYGNDDISDCLMIGAGCRYYIVQNGLYLGANVKLLHTNHNYNDLMPGFEIGYAYFIGKSVTIEPALYYDQSFKKHSDYSKIGFRIGLGLYL